MRGGASDYLELVKPRLLSLALATVLVGFFLGVRGPVDHGALLGVLFGAALVGAGANALNQYLERDVDARMKRTENRPLPSGRLSPMSVFVFGLATSAAGVIYLFAAVNAMAAAMGVLTLVSYVLIYTPMKRKTYFNTFVGAIPGALPFVLGWTASGRALGVEVASLFLLLYVWQIPHFYAIAWVYRDDYKNGGLRMITGEDPDGGRIAWRILCFSVLMIPIGTLPTFTGLAREAYFVSAAFFGVVLTAFAARLVFRRMEGAKSFVSVSIFYLMAIIVAMMADKS